MKDPWERFLAGVDTQDPRRCWNWTRALTAAGYGQLYVAPKVVYTHRFTYERFVGRIPKGYEIDHLCRNRKCCNPRHLEAVKHHTNVNRGYWGKNTCSRGHKYDRVHRTRGHRLCNKCEYEWQKAAPSRRKKKNVAA